MTDLEFGPMSWSFPVMPDSRQAVLDKAKEWDLKVREGTSGGNMYVDVEGATTDQLMELVSLSGFS